MFSNAVENNTTKCDLNRRLNPNKDYGTKDLYVILMASDCVHHFLE